MGIKEIVSEKFPGLVLLINEWGDFSTYRKYNYANNKNKSKEAMDGKILRQTHIIEKGLSLSHPRKGFGQEKIHTLIQYLNMYQSLGYDVKSTAFLNAVHVLQAYQIYQRKIGYENNEVNEYLNHQKKYIQSDFACGIKDCTRAEIERSIQGDFKALFENRHSIRQFSDKPVDIDLVKKAARLAMKAPSACNRQSAKVYYFKEPEKNQKLGKVINGNTGFEAEVKNYLVITSDINCYTSSYERNQPYVDGSLYAMSLMLCLEYYGIASCALQNSEARPLDKAIRRITGIPKNEVIVLFIAIGNYKDEFTVAVSKRKNLEDVLIIE